MKLMMYVVLLIGLSVSLCTATEKSTLDEIGGYALAAVDGAGLKEVETANITVEKLGELYEVSMDLTVHDIAPNVLGSDLNMLGLVADKIFERYSQEPNQVNAVNVRVKDRSRVIDQIATVVFHPNVMTKFMEGLGVEPTTESMLKTRLN